MSDVSKQTEAATSIDGALAALVAQCPDALLDMLRVEAAGMSGPRGEAFLRALDRERIDRARCNIAFGPLFPIFVPRDDGVESLVFPPAVMRRVWRAACARESDTAHLLDEDDAGRRSLVIERLCLAAAWALRERPDTLWPPQADGSGRAERLAMLEDLAGCFDIAMLAHRALPRLPQWVGRASEDDIIVLRLLMRDCARASPDGPRRMIELLFAHMPDAYLVLRLLNGIVNPPSRDPVVGDEEIVLFTRRLSQAMQSRCAQLETRVQAAATSDVDFAGADLAEDVRADLGWCAQVLTEMDIHQLLRPDHEAMREARDVRRIIAKRLTQWLAAAPDRVDEALPMMRVHVTGRIRRMAPNLDVASSPEKIEQAVNSVALIGAMRGSASVFGCEAGRGQVQKALATRLYDDADETLERFNTGEAPDPATALARAGVAARLLFLLGEDDVGRAVRRRVAAATGRLT